MDFLFHFLFSPLPTPAVISLFALAAATLLYLNTRPSPVRSPIDLGNQSVGIQVESTQLVPEHLPGMSLKTLASDWLSSGWCKEGRAAREQQPGVALL